MTDKYLRWLKWFITFQRVMILACSVLLVIDVVTKTWWGVALNGFAVIINVWSMRRLEWQIKDMET